MRDFKTHYQILEEDLQSSLNQARNILKSNNAGENTESILKNLKAIYDGVAFEDDQHRVANKDTNIPALAFWLIADPSYARIREDYRQYVNTRSLYQKDFLINTVENLKGEITKRKLFKNPEEKLSLIKQVFSDMVAVIHREYTPPVSKDTNKKFISGEKNDDVVYEDNSIVIYRADSKAKCIKYGSGSSLCISTRGGSNYYWSYRMGNMRDDGLGMTTYFVYWKNSDNRILIDALGDEDGPANKYSWNPIRSNIDRDVTPEQLINNLPELGEPFKQNVFQFIPYGERERRYQWISENVYYLLDPNLLTLEDYEMFIENFDGETTSYTTGERGIKYDGWDRLSEKIGEKPTAYLVKKYAGLGNLVDIKTQERFLTPKDRQWYLDDVLFDEGGDDTDDIMAYCKFVDGEKIPEKMILKLISYGGYLEEYLSQIVGFDEDVAGHVKNRLFLYFKQFKKPDTISSKELYQNVVDFVMGRNLTPDLLNYLFKDCPCSGAYDIPHKLIMYYNKNNISIPKPLIKSIVSEPLIAYKYRKYWVKNKKTPPPKILLDTILKSPTVAFYYAKDLRLVGRGDDIPEEVEKAIFKDPYLTYQYIERQFNNKGFAEYPTDFLIKLFSTGANGYRYLDENNGFGVFEKGRWRHEEDNKKIRRAMMKNVMDNSRIAYERSRYGDFNDPNRTDIFMKLIRKAAKQFKQESYRLSQVDTIKEIVRQVK